MFRFLSTSIHVTKRGHHHHRRRLLQQHSHPHHYTTTTPTLHRCVRDMTEHDFDTHADNFLEDLMENLEVLETTAGPEFEIDYAMGVLTLVLNEETTYVLNKQRPNRQVWMSSPTSGPRRFELDEDFETWLCVRSRENLLGIMKAELQILAPDVELELE